MVPARLAVRWHDRRSGDGDEDKALMATTGARGPAMDMADAIGLARRRAGKRRKGKPSCVDCFFHCQMLCALDLDEPCSTFRPNSDDGLVPPRQPALLLRQAPDERAVRAP